MLGLLDSVDFMEPKVRQVLLDLMAGWPSKSVREAATEKLAPPLSSDETSSAPSQGDHPRDQGPSMPAYSQPALF